MTLIYKFNRLNTVLYRIEMGYNSLNLRNLAKWDIIIGYIVIKIQRY